MLNHRISTFLKLCEEMNYRKTAEALNMTQPAVTQHIHFLEEEYGCKLFSYNGRTLTITEQGLELEKYARSVLYNDKIFREKLARKPALRLSIGATKTIGDFTIGPKLIELLSREDIELELLIDNTDNLLAKLNELKLDLLLIEGFFDKNNYGYSLIKQEEFTGICARNHRFAGRTVALSELFEEHIILREEGSGTRAVLEQFLYEKGYSTDSFRRRSVISSFKLIEEAVSANCGISFVYESIPRGNEELATFSIQNASIFHEFNFVYLKNSSVEPFLKILI